MACPEDFPTVTLVTAVYNEGEVLSKKLHNLEQLDYPPSKLFFLFGSDGSTDCTNELLNGVTHPNFAVKIYAQRRGKAAVLNDLLSEVETDLVMLSDGNTMHSPDSVKSLVRHFSDRRVGAVCGELVLQADNTTTGGLGEGWYWAFENAMKRMESEISTTIGATGAIYAVRRSLVKPLPVNRPVMDDFLISLDVVRQGYMVKYDPHAVAYEIPANSIEGEFKRRVRIGAANFHGLKEFADLLHPRYGFAAFALWSRKIIRWSIPFLVLIAVMCSIALAFGSGTYRFVLFFEGLFLVAAAFGYWSEKRRFRIGILGLPYYVVAMNAALFIGFMKFISNKQPTTWEVVRSR